MEIALRGAIRERDRLHDGRGAVGHGCDGANGDDRLESRVARTPRRLGGTLVRLDRERRLAHEEEHHPLRGERLRETVVVTQPYEDGHHRFELLDRLLLAELGLDLASRPDRLCGRERDHMLVAEGTRELESFVGGVASTVQVVGVEPGFGQLDEQRDAARISFAAKEASATEQHGGGSGVVARERTPAAVRESRARPRCEHGCALGIGAQLFQVAARLLEVMPDDLVELDQTLPVLLEPGGEPLVEIRARRLRQRVVRRVADEDVPEAERVVVRERRALGPYELLSHEPEQPRRNLRILGRERLHGRAVEHLPFDGAALERRTLRPRQLVEPRRQQCVDARRDGHLGIGRRLEHRHHLLDEERIAVGRREDALAKVRLDVPRELGEEQVARLVTERLQQDRGRVELAARPAGSTVEQLGTRHAEKQDRSVARPVGDVLDEIEERVLGPVKVVPDDDERPFARRLFEQAPDGEGDLLLRRDPVRAEEHTERAGNARIELALVRPQLFDGFDDGPVRDALAVRETPSADDRRIDPAHELRDEARLADAGHAEQREELARAVRGGDVERLAQEALLALAPDERRVEAAPRFLRASHRHETERLDRLRLALQCQRLDRLDLDRRARELHGLRADVDLVRGRRLLEPRRDVDGVARDEPLVGSRHDLARVHADAGLHADRRQRVAHLGCGSKRAQRIVLVQHRHAENGHHRVADELLDGPAMTLDDRPHLCKTAVEHGAQQLWVEALP